MIPRSYTAEGFILGRRNFGEADRIIDVYSKEKGKVSLMAKGIRRTSSRKRGHLEIFSKVRFQAATGSNLGIMTEVETLDSLGEVRKSMKKVTLAYYFMEVLGKAVHEGEANPELYNFLSEEMEKLKTTKALKKLRLGYITGLLRLLGFWPKDRELNFPDEKLDEVLERQIYSKRVGKIMLE